jgi:type I restriction enzyme R subunit
MNEHGGEHERLTAEQRARVLIDQQLVAPDWVVQDKQALNLFAGQGIAVRETVMAAGHGRADYLLYVDKAAVGVIEAKPEGTPLSGVEWQSAMYAEGLPADVRLKALTVDGRLPFVFEASGTETHFTNGYDPDPRARKMFTFPMPSTLARFIRDADANPHAPTWRGKVRALPALEFVPLRPAQIDAILGVERSLAEQRSKRSLVQMATGAGKTYTAVTQSYRLLRYGGFNRVLFLVDRNNLADQRRSSRTTEPPRTRTERLEALEEDLQYTPGQLDRAVTAKSQIRTVLETFRDRLFTEIFPGRSTVPKTLIFAKDDAPASGLGGVGRVVVKCERDVGKCPRWPVGRDGSCGTAKEI